MKKENIFSNLLMKMVAFGLLALSCFVMTGWIIHSTLLVQIHPSFVPMQFNTALCFFLTSAVIFLTQTSSSKLARLLSALMILLVILTLSEYIFGSNLGIDTLFVLPFTHVNVVHPGRMAPNTALAFFVVGIILFVVNTPSRASSYKLELVTLLSFLVEAVGLFALFGYFSGVKTAYGWGRFTFMAFHTALGFSLLGLGFIVSFLKKNIKKNRWLVLAPGICTLLITLLLWQLFNYFENKQVSANIQFESKTLSASIETELNTQLLAIHRMGKRMAMGEAKSQSFWNQDAKNYISDAGYYRAIFFLDKQMNILWMQPQDNHSLRKDIESQFQNKLSPFMNELLTTDKPVISPLFEIDQRPLCLLAVSVMNDSENIGFIVGLVEPIQLLDRYLNATSLLENFKIEAYEGKQKFYESKGEGSTFKNQIGYSYAMGNIRLGNRDWSLSLYPTNSYLNQSSSSSPEIILIFGTLLSLFVSLAMLLAQKAKESEIAANRFRQIINGVSDYAIIWLDLKGKIQSWNPGIRHLFGYESDEVIGKHFSMFYTPQERSKGIPDHSLEVGIHQGRYQTEEQRMRKDGSIFDALVTVEGLHDPDGKLIGFAKIIRDISDWKKIEKMKNEFISTVSHELRTPLTSIRGALGILQGGLAGDLPDKSKPLVKIALNNSERLIRLINDILDIEKMESGKMEFHLQIVDLNQTISLAVEANLAFAAEFEVALEFQANDKSLWVKADPDRITQVITNLISNAVKFSSKGEKVRILSKKIHDRARVEVIDSGPGISEAFKSKIFSKFVQADSSDTRQKGGTGLGLSISKNIIESSGGTIGFESSNGQGANFFFEIPLQDISSLQKNSNDKIKKPSQNLTPNSKSRILHIEDDAETCFVVSSMLGKDVLVEQASTLQEGIQRISEKAYDTIIIDIGLPDGSGLDLLNNLKISAFNSKTPLILFSASEDLPKNMTDQFSAVLLKSKTSNEEFIEAIHKTVHNHHISKEQTYESNT